MKIIIKKNKNVESYQSWPTWTCEISKFDWEYTKDSEKVALQDYYKKLIHIRKDYSCLRTGAFKTLFADGMVYSYLRSDEHSSIAVILNNDTKIHNIKIPFDSHFAIDLLTEKEYLIVDGMLEIELDAMSGAILR